MTSKRLIPCLDIRDGRVVKGTNFVNIRDAGDPVEMAKYYYSEMADELVFLDITATHEGRPAVIDLARQVGENTFIPFTVGGGLQSVEDIRLALLAGADKVSLNSAAVKRPNLIKESSEVFGSQCIVVAIDAKRVGDSWNVFTHGGRINTGIDVLEWAQQIVELGAGEILLTSMDNDGTREGYDLPLTRLVSTSVPIPVIASGGAGTAQHLVDALTTSCADAVLLAGILHDGVTRICDLKRELVVSGIRVRES